MCHRARIPVPRLKPTSGNGLPQSNGTETILQSCAGLWATKYMTGFHCALISKALLACWTRRDAFVDSDGVWGIASYNGRTIFEAKYDRDTLGLYFTQFDEIFGDQVNNPDKYKSPRPKKPMILHEAGNYVTFSRPDLIDEFKHNFKPFWLSAGKAKLEKLGLLSEANGWAEKSERLYALCHKFNLESARRNPYVSGYHWWLFQDYWTTANGIVDHYFRPKSITKEEVLKYNNDVVLLQDGLQRTYRGKEHLSLKLAGI